MQPDGQRNEIIGKAKQEESREELAGQSLGKRSEGGS